jgi:hypothetical protein
LRYQIANGTTERAVVVLGMQMGFSLPNGAQKQVRSPSQRVLIELSAATAP